MMVHFTLNGIAQEMRVRAPERIKEKPIERKKSTNPQHWMTK